MVQVFRGLPPVADMPIALTIGNFDGVHRGHQAMLSRLVEAADDLALPASVLTFDPPPREFFARASAPPRLSSLAGQGGAVRRSRGGAHLRRPLRRAARFARAGGVHRYGARAPPRRTLAAGGRGLPLRQGPCGRHFDAAPRGADVQRRGDAHRATWTASARRRRPCARRSRQAISRAPARCSAARSRSPAGSRTDRSSGADWDFRRRTCRRSACLRSPASSPCASTASKPRPGRVSRASACARRWRRRARRWSKYSCSTSMPRSTAGAISVEFVHKLRDEERYADFDRSKRQIARDVDGGARLFQLVLCADALTPFPNATFESNAPHARRTEDRLQDHAQSAGHAIPHARRSREARAGLGQGVASRRRSTRPSGRRRRAVLASCCTTARRTRTTTFTSATRSTRS